MELTITDSEKDLGIWITSSLKPSLQCDKAAATASRILGMLKRTFTKLLRELFVFLYRTYVRPHLEYCIQLWCPYLARNIDKLENVQRRATKLVTGLANLPYESRLSFTLFIVDDNVAILLKFTKFYMVITILIGQDTLL